MKTLIAVLSLLAPLIAAAAPPVPPCAPPLPYTYQSATAGYWMSESHEVRYWFCQGKFEWTYHGVVYANGTALIVMPTSLKEGWKAVTSDWTEPQWAPVMERARMTILPHLETMPAPAYVVAPSGSAATRLTYAFTPTGGAPNATNGSKAAKASGTIPVGTPCDCSMRIASPVYCRVPASGVQVAACVRKP